MNNNKINIIAIALLIAALVGGIMLVNQSQDSRRGAYFAGASLSVIPANPTAKVGDPLLTQLSITTENGVKLAGIETTICYGNGLSLDPAKLDSQVVVDKTALKTVFDVSLKTIADKKCVHISAFGDSDTTKLKTGTFSIVSFKFDTTAAATGTISIDESTTKIGGLNTAANATDTSMRLTSVSNSDYTISNVNGPTCVPRPACLDATPPCKMPELDTYCPKPTPTGITGIAPYLKFKMSFLGIRPGAKCALPGDMPLTVTVRAPDGTNKTFNNVPTILETDTEGNLAIYDVQVKLDGFNYTNNLAVFIKGPKHLQVKYGKNNQTSFYGVAGGELSGLTTDMTTTPVFNFTGYPLLAGDVTGPSNVQDGVVDGLDFSLVKSESNKRSSVNPGGYMLADLNGNCQMESQDLSNLMLSLSVKQGQLY